MPATLLSLRRHRGWSQAYLAQRAEVQLQRIRACEYGMGHGFRRGGDWAAFPDDDFFESLATAYDSSNQDMKMLYGESVRQGDRQPLDPTELPNEWIIDLITGASLTIDDIIQMADITQSRIEAVAAGHQWASVPEIGRIARALHVTPLRIELSLWRAHHWLTQKMMRAGKPPPSRPPNRAYSRSTDTTWTASF